MGILLRLTGMEKIIVKDVKQEGYCSISDSLMKTLFTYQSYANYPKGSRQLKRLCSRNNLQYSHDGEIVTFTAKEGQSEENGREEL